MDNAMIPFEWDDDTPPEMNDTAADRPSTITASEAEIFKSIFDEIALGRMPPAKKRPAASSSSAEPRSASGPSLAQPAKGMPKSIVEQARITKFREKILHRYPSSLREAAQVALGLYELEPSLSHSAASKMVKLDEAEQAKWEERAKYERLRTEERERVDALMKGCETDVALWDVMEAEVFSLPARLGILQPSPTPARTTPRKWKSKSDPETKSASETHVPPPAEAHERLVMDICGPLYSYFIDHGLVLFETAFARPSDYAFEILPRVKKLGLPSYVLGVSSPFYTRLARMHWNRFGDAVSALDLLQEMNTSGLYPEESTRELLLTIRDHLHGCSWGAQGPFVMGMMEAPPYDASLTQRLQDMKKFAASV